MKKKKVIKTLYFDCSEQVVGYTYWVNRQVEYVDPDTALEYARKQLPTISMVRVYVSRNGVCMHTRKPSYLWVMATEERMHPFGAWSIFEAHARMLVR